MVSSIDNVPAKVFPSIVGRPMTEKVMVGTLKKDVYVGDEVTKMSEVWILLLKFRSPNCRVLWGKRVAVE